MRPDTGILAFEYSTMVSQCYQHNRMTPLQRELQTEIARCLMSTVMFYAHLPTGKRFLSKEDVLRYINEGKVSSCDMDVLCDTRTDDNILAHLEFNPDGLPDGWVKEVIFRKCNDGIRKDPVY
ncbi:hypothetical protein PR202_gb25761 [Eleusine coracana subsp. coracana]|uniref:MBD domain-containing protein n=1 Tax=Eleusine coracana subsp. coracana TaxID=191504 RepID=A0AAV5FQ18_ELECO|nr:hypothetical protein PR202_gb25761 [Eleusine coracana subsp. coracana]